MKKGIPEDNKEQVEKYITNSLIKDYTQSRAKKLIHVATGMKIRVHEHDIVTFWYEVDDDIECEFGLLCEVGESWRVVFDRYLKDNNIVLSTWDTQDYYGQYIIK